MLSEYIDGSKYILMIHWFCNGDLYIDYYFTDSFNSIKPYYEEFKAAHFYSFIEYAVLEFSDITDIIV